MRPINRCLNPKLEQICQQVMKLETLNQIVQKYLPESVREHCYVGSFNQGCLRLVVNNPVWASELRYSLPELRDTLRREAGIYQLSAVKLDIITDTPVKQKKSKTLKISDKARQMIIKQAELMTDEKLKKALYKLADFDEETSSPQP